MIEPADQPTLTLRKAGPGDWPLIGSWLEMPEIARWLGNPSAAHAAIQTVFETDGAISCIVECDARPVGYAHAIDAAHWGPELPEGIPPGSWDIDVFIARRDLRGRGLGTLTLDLLAAEVFSTTFALALSAIVSVKDEPAIRAYERAGFKWARVCNDPIFGASWLMIKQRPR